MKKTSKSKSMSKKKVEPRSQLPLVDPNTYRPDQLTWFSKVVQKDLKFYLFYFLGFGFLIWRTPPPQNPPVFDFDIQFSRAIVTSLFALVALVTLWIDIFRGTPAEPGDRKWILMGDGVGGHFCYLTINILTAWAIYWPLCAMAEIGVLMENPFAMRALYSLYSCAVFSSTLGTLLTLLFLKFNWFDASWRKEVLTMYDQRKNTTFRKKILFTHLNQLPIAFFDCAVLKHNRVLNATSPSYFKLLAICFVYSFVYLAFTHLNFRVNGGVYPYSFMDVIFKSWISEISFFVGLSLFCFMVSSLYHFIASDELSEIMVANGFF